MQRGRPLGLTIALLACTLFYGLYPVAVGIFYLVFNSRRNDPIEPRVWLTLVIGLGFLALMVPAWLGRPPQMRVMLTGVVLILAVINVVVLIGDLTSQPQSALAPGGISSGTEVSRTLSQCALPIYILVPLYILWYLNRYPSRAYYRGAALDSPPAGE